MKVNGKDDIPYIMENKKCLKPQTRQNWHFWILNLLMLGAEYILPHPEVIKDSLVRCTPSKRVCLTLGNSNCKPNYVFSSEKLAYNLIITYYNHFIWLTLEFTIWSFVTLFLSDYTFQSFKCWCLLSQRSVAQSQADFPLKHMDLWSMKWIWRLKMLKLLCFNPPKSSKDQLLHHLLHENFENLHHW